MAITKRQIALVVIAAVMLGLGTLYLRSLGKEKSEGNGTALNITLIGKGGTVIVRDYGQLTEMESVAGKVAYQNLLGDWVEAGDLLGVRLAVLVEMVGGMEPGDSARITSTDGSYQDYAYYNVYPDADWKELQGDLVLAFSSKGQAIPGWEEGPMSAFLPPDEAYSNEDCRYTSGPGQGYFVTQSGGARFVVDVWKVEVVETAGEAEEWSMELGGIVEKNLTRTEFRAMASEYRANMTTQEGARWSGIPLWRLLGLIDGGARRGEGSYNATYAAEGYEIKLVGSANMSYSSHQVDRNDSILIADTTDGIPLASPALVAPDTVVEGLKDIRFFPLWKTKVHGERTLDLFYSEISELESIEGSAGYLKVTGTVVGPFAMRGVPLLSVLELSGELPAEYSVEVTAADGYSIMLSEEEVKGEVDIFDLAGNKIGFGGARSVLYYEVDGSLDFSGKPFRLGFLKGDGAITDSHYWIKEVNRVTIKGPVTEWSLELSGLTHYILNRTAFEAAATCSEHSVVLNITHKEETHSYQGLPIWVPISIVDGKEDPEGHYFFNDDLARQGYEVRITAADGFSTTMNSSLLWRNNMIILAYLEDGEILPEGDGPLRLVGEGLASKQMLKQVVRIELVLPEQQ